MDTTLSIAFFSILLPLIAAIIAAKGPKKYKHIYTNFLFLSAGITIGLFINHLAGRTRHPEVTREIVGPTWIGPEESRKLTESISVRYISYQMGTVTLLVQSQIDQVHIELRTPGQQFPLYLDGQDYILEYVQGSLDVIPKVAIKLNKIHSP